MKIASTRLGQSTNICHLLSKFPPRCCPGSMFWISKESQPWLPELNIVQFYRLDQKLSLASICSGESAAKSVGLICGEAEVCAVVFDPHHKSYPRLWHLIKGQGSSALVSATRCPRGRVVRLSTLVKAFGEFLLNRGWAGLVGLLNLLDLVLSTAAENFDEESQHDQRREVHNACPKSLIVVRDH